MHKLNSKLQCNSKTNYSYYKCYGKSVRDIIQTNSTFSCVPIYHKDTIRLILNESFVICETYENNVKSNELIFKNLFSGDVFERCKPSCTHYEYFGKTTRLYDSQTNLTSVQFNYFLQSSELITSQEYYVYDFVGMIGYVGGSLGLFLGFSFLDCLLNLLKAIENWQRQKWQN